MKIEAVITCSNYSDFLAHTLPLNRSLFDRLVVVTSPEDRETQRVCEYWHVECLKTDRMETHWGRFKKGRGINDGLAKLDKLQFLTEGMTIGQAAIKWLLAEPLVTTVLPNIYRDDQLEEFVAAADKPDLTEAQLTLVADLYDRNFDLVSS